MPTTKPEIKVLVTEDERERLRATAAESGLTMSNYVRKKLKLKPMIRTGNRTKRSQNSDR